MRLVIVLLVTLLCVDIAATVVLYGAWRTERRLRRYADATARRYARATPTTRRRGGDEISIRTLYR
ncbi:hypothetical protein Athai_18590 [Actinocatenispora thailandica]|uniref:Uncharacterized protein n=1 Tax=Actinocatenispora thailandica TaxID=227318 RepID=A0A7R7HW42_9ACTN|nr:hypothetical protein [Actinocatenispora thailandica]BCJ34356.1 hypothetical protein Athai_18590 [Actinocatenispora thailandica]